jgi:DNA-3-methyladenine glycosylase I
MKQNYNSIFEAAYNSLEKQSVLNTRDFAKSFESYKKMQNQKYSDDEVFWKLVYVTFYSGFRASTVTGKLERIKAELGNFQTLRKLHGKDVTALYNDPGLIRNKKKIDACIRNAVSFNELIKAFGSFNEYLKSFGDLDNVENSNELIKDLKLRFYYLGEITTYHLLMDLGLNYVKPDRVLCRIFYRLGLIPSVKSYDEVIQVGRTFAKSTGYPIRFIDIVFVNYGQEDSKPVHGLRDGICLEEKPKCEVCGLRKYCKVGL